MVNFMCPSLNDIYRGLVFETSASEGAILTMPEGAVAYHLKNIPAFREYVAANVGKWYKFVNSVRGCKAKNGDVRLVSHQDKVSFVFDVLIFRKEALISLALESLSLECLCFGWASSVLYVILSQLF